MPPALLTKKKQRRLLKDRAYAELKRRILAGRHRPGEFLSERQLADELAMSQTPIRAAVDRLEAEGLLAVSPQQGIVVRDLSIHEIADQFEIRFLLGPFVLRHLAGRLTKEQAERLEENLSAQKAATRQRDVDRIVELDAGFHILFCEYHGNREILRVMEQLRDKIHRIIHRVSGQNPERLAVSYEEHRGIADAVLAGDPELAARRIEQHLEFGKQFLLSPRQR
jgi:DNA-binding GntR family transcriptional regulator